MKNLLDKEARVRDIKREVRLLKKRKCDQDVVNIFDKTKKAAKKSNNKKQPVAQLSEEEKRKKNEPLSFKK